MITRNYTFLVVLLILILSACSGGGGGSHKLAPGPIDLWTWTSGSDVVDQMGVYNSMTADPLNVPGARQGAVTWTDASGNFWLFGGLGYDKNGGTLGELNDLWKWDGSNWTWVWGSDTVNQTGVYNSMTADPLNVPGARDGAASWTDASGNLCLFGGHGYDGGGTLSWLNDLWCWDGTDWTWMSGSNTGNQNSTYGTANDVPGGRQAAVSWTDANGDLWLFGGNGYGVLTSPNKKGQLNDLWHWDNTAKKWIFVSGSNTINQIGTYGTASDVPGARQAAVGWIDSNGKLWLFGGYGHDSADTISQLNDLWKWDGTKWTWISGSNTVDQAGTYGTRGTVSASNIPGARYAAVSSTDASGNVWLFGGQGIDGGNLAGRLNDLWRWDGSNWTWISGSDTKDQSGIYGALGIAGAVNAPGARTYSMSWTDSSGNFWLFGGFGFDSSGSVTPGRLNDLWRYQP